MNEIQLASRIDLAHTLIQEEKHLHAIQVYLRLIRLEPDFIPAYIELSSLYAELGMVTAAGEQLRHIENRYPDNKEITFLLGSLYTRTEEYDTALMYFKKLATLKLPQVHFNMGVAFFYRNNVKLAEEQFRLTLKYDPQFPKINESLGELLIKRNAFAEAIAYLKKGIAADPYSAVNHHLLGVAYSRVYDWKNAYCEFVLAIEMNPNESANWHLCGEMLIQLKRFDEAEQYVRKALELHPQSVDALVVLGQLYTKRGDAAKAKEYIDRALTIDPKNNRAREASWKLRGVRKQHSKP